jgi:uncharacterized membrane protein
MTLHRILSMVFAIAILLAPFIALLYGRLPGLIVLAATLAATIGIGLSARESIEPERRPLLGLMLMVNAILLALAVVGVIFVAT